MPSDAVDEELEVRGGAEEDEDLAQLVVLPAAGSKGAADRGISEEEGDGRAWQKRRRSVEIVATQQS